MNRDTEVNNGIEAARLLSSIGRVTSDTMRGDLTLTTRRGGFYLLILQAGEGSFQSAADSHGRVCSAVSAVEMQQP